MDRHIEEPTSPRGRTATRHNPALSCSVFSNAFSLLVMLIVPAHRAFGTELRCTAKKYMDKPAIIEPCEVEGCGDIYPNFVVADMKLYKQPDITSEWVDTLKKCEPLGSFTTYEVTESKGVARVVKPGACPHCKSLKPGDRLTIVSQISEGQFTLCAGNILIDAVIPGVHEPVPQPDYTVAQIIKKPRSSSWIKVTTPRGKTGYAPLLDTNRALVWSPTEKILSQCKSK